MMLDVLSENRNIILNSPQANVLRVTLEPFLEATHGLFTTIKG